MYNNIIACLPYKSSFLFVDNVTALSDNGVTGEYTLKPDSFFYEDHFIGNPVTPGVIITEIMAQIGLVVFAIYLMTDDKIGTDVVMSKDSFPLLTSTEVSFFKMVLPGEKVTVSSEKEFFRFGKLKCKVEMHNEQAELVARGVFAGIVKNALINKQK